MAYILQKNIDIGMKSYYNKYEIVPMEVTMEMRQMDEFRCFNNLVDEIDAVYHEAALRLNLSDSALSILYTISNYGDECMLNDIVNLSGISKQTINSALRKLESDEILYLEDTGKGRKIVHLTKKGKELIDNSVVKLIQIENDIFASWNDKERRLYLELTQRYLSDLKERIMEL